MAIGNQWPIGKFLRCRINEVLKLWGVHQRMSKWLLRCQWNDMKESVHNKVNEPMSRWLYEPMNQWISQPMNQWINEAMSQWINQPVTQWIDESMNQWFSESLNQWTNKSVNEWMNEMKWNEMTWHDMTWHDMKWNEMKWNEWTKERTNEWNGMNAWMNEWIFEWMIEWMNQSTNQSINQSVNQSINQWINESINESMNQATDDAVKKWNNESTHEWIRESMNQWIKESVNQWMNEVVSRVMSGWTNESAMTQWINRASSTMVKRYFLRSCYNAFSELQLQSRLPGASQYRSCFATCSRANAFCHSRLQPRIAGASHQIDQRSRSPGNGDDSALRRFFFLVTFIWNRALATVWCTFCPPHLPKVFRLREFFSHFEVQIKLSLQPCALFVDNCPRARLGTAETNYSGDPRSHFTQKTLGFAPESVFHPWMHALPNCYTSQVVDMMMWLTWCWEC